MRLGPGGLEWLLPTSTGEPWDSPNAALLVSGAREPWDGPDAAWLLVLGLLVSSAGEPWDGPDATWPGVLLSALGAGVWLFSRHLLGQL